MNYLLWCSHREPLRPVLLCPALSQWWGGITYLSSGEETKCPCLSPFTDFKKRQWNLTCIIPQNRVAKGGLRTGMFKYTILGPSLCHNVKDHMTSRDIWESLLKRQKLCENYKAKFYIWDVPIQIEDNTRGVVRWSWSRTNSARMDTKPKNHVKRCHRNLQEIRGLFFTRY